jgi:chromosome segregation ATPase
MPERKSQKFDPRICDLRKQACYQKIEDMEKRLAQAIEQSNVVSNLANKGHRESLQSAMGVIQKTFDQGSAHFKELERQIDEIRETLKDDFDQHGELRNDIKQLSENFTNFRISWMKEIEKVKEKLETDIKESKDGFKKIDDKVNKWRNIGIGVVISTTSLFAIVKVVILLMDKI